MQHFHVVTEDTIAAAVSPRHELAAHSDIALTALAEWTLIALPQGTGIRPDQPRRPGLY